MDVQAVSYIHAPGIGRPLNRLQREIGEHFVDMVMGQEGFKVGPGHKNARRNKMSNTKS